MLRVSWFSEEEHSCSSFVCPLWISGVYMLHLGNLLPGFWTQNQPHSLGLADPGSKELLLYKKLILADTKLLVFYSGLPHLIHWQEYFKDNSEAESYYWPCQRHRKSGGKRELISKIRRPGPSTLSVQDWLSDFGQRLSPSGFWFPCLSRGSTTSICKPQWAQKIK